MKKYRSLDGVLKHVKRIRIIHPSEYEDFNKKMEEVKRESRIKQARSWKSAGDIWLR